MLLLLQIGIILVMVATFVSRLKHPVLKGKGGESKERLHPVPYWIYMSFGLLVVIGLAFV